MAYQHDTSCPQCGNQSRIVIPMESGPHHAKEVCATEGCGHFFRWMPKPITLERAKAFTMPYGQHQGKTLEELAQSETGQNYLRWALTTVSLSPAVRKMMELILDQKEVVEK